MRLVHGIRAPGLWWNVYGYIMAMICYFKGHDNCEVYCGGGWCVRCGLDKTSQEPTETGR